MDLNVSDHQYLTLQLPSRTLHISTVGLLSLILRIYHHFCPFLFFFFFFYFSPFQDGWCFLYLCILCFIYSPLKKKNPHPPTIWIAYLTHYVTAGFWTNKRRASDEGWWFLHQREYLEVFHSFDKWRKTRHPIEIPKLSL